MKTLRDMAYDGPRGTRSLLRVHNGEYVDLIIILSFDDEDYYRGRLLVHPTRLIVDNGSVRVSVPIDSTNFYHPNYPLLAYVDEYTWRYKDGGRFKVYRRDSKGDTLIQQGTY